MRLLRLLVRLLKGFYDIVASYLLAWILLFTGLAFGLQTLFSLVVGQWGHGSSEIFWHRIAHRLPLPVVYFRLLAFGLALALSYFLLRPILKPVGVRLDGWVDRFLVRYKAWKSRFPKAGTFFGASFSLFITLLLVPFIIQPTLVPMNWGAKAWIARAANLVDGTASGAIVDSAVGLYRKFYAKPSVTSGVSKDDFNRSYPPEGTPPPASGNHPMMDRWDPIIWNTVAGSKRGFALVKTFIRIESAGLQFAVSRTGCAGLMQFCRRTAQSGGFRKIFGTGQVYPCRCSSKGKRGCRVTRSVLRDLESGDATRIARQKADFPCELTDARFDARKSIRAGWLFISRLEQKFGGNLYLMYIAYNSGPAVSARLMKTLARREKASLSEIASALPAALRPYYSSKAESRARSLVKVHLPRIARTFETYIRQARGQRAKGLVIPASAAPSFRAFSDKLLQLKNGARTGVRISVWGGSHIAADIFTAQLRKRFHENYGDGGPGYVALGMPWGGYRHSQLKLGASGRWRTHSVQKSKDYQQGHFGISGYTMVAEVNSSARLSPKRPVPLEFVDLHYLRQPKSGRLAIQVDGKTGKVIKSKSPKLQFGVERLQLPPTVKRIDIGVANEPVAILGVDIRHQAKGVILDSLGINGAQAHRILRTDQILLAEQLKRMRSDLLVLAFGSNEINNGKLTMVQFGKRLDKLLARMKEALPESTCLLILPNDQARRQKGTSVYRTPARLALIARATEKAAARNGCAYWHQQRAMGGEGSIFRWVKNSLAQKDHLHHTARGYRRLANMLYGELSEAVRGKVSK